MDKPTTERAPIAPTPKQQHLMKWWAIKDELEAQIAQHLPADGEEPSAEYRRLRALIDQANTCLVEGKETGVDAVQ